jgi:hypothetical protein
MESRIIGPIIEKLAGYHAGNQQMNHGNQATKSTITVHANLPECKKCVEILGTMRYQ